MGRIPHIERFFILFFFFFSAIRCTEKPDPPVIKVELTTVDISSVGLNSASSGGNITVTGHVEIMERGVCWYTQPGPTILNNKTVDGNGSGSFVSEVVGLIPGTEYYLRAYARTPTQTFYGNEMKFQTLLLSIIGNSAISSITPTSVIVQSEIAADGGLPILERGFCWNTSTGPTTNNLKKTAQLAGTLFEVEISGLIPNTEYYVRAYCITAAGTSYGQEIEFRTPGLASVKTYAATVITETSAIVTGTVISDGGFTGKIRGICLGAQTNTCMDLIVDTGTGIGDFSIKLKGLIPNTTYYFRAYYMGLSGPIFGEELSFKTLPAPSVSTKTAHSFTPHSTATGGIVVSNGGEILEKGICWSLGGNQFPTIEDNKISAGPGPGSFDITIYSLSSNTFYTARAYAITDGGVFYGVYTSIMTEGDIYSIPTLLSPLNNASFQCCQVNFSWSWTGNFYFEIQISKASDFSGTVYSKSLSCTSGELSLTGVNSRIDRSTSLCVKMDSLSYDGLWYWRVRNSDPYFGNGPWSEVRAFNFKNQ